MKVKSKLTGFECISLSQIYDLTQLVCSQGFFKQKISIANPRVDEIMKS